MIATPGRELAWQAVEMANPIYRVIYGDLAAQIADGVLQPSARVPSEAELSERYGVSRMTVRQALTQLADEQLVVRRRGSGTFVTSSPTRFRSLNRLGSFEQEIGLDSSRLRTEIIRRKVGAPPAHVAERLMLKPRQDAIELCRVRHVDDRPVALQQSWIPFAAAPGLARDELVDGSLYRTLAERYGLAVQWAEQEIFAVLADAVRATALDVDVGAPLTANRRLTYAAGNPIEFAFGWTRGEFPLLVRLSA